MFGGSRPGFSLIIVLFLICYAVVFFYSAWLGVGMILGFIFLLLIIRSPVVGVLFFVSTVPFFGLLSLPVTSGGFEMSKVILLVGVVITCTRAVIIQDVGLFRGPVTSASSLTVLGFFVLSLISYANSVGGKFVGVEMQLQVYSILAYFFVVMNLNNMKEVEKVIWCMLGASFIVSLLGIIELSSGSTIYKLLGNKSLFGGQIELELYTRTGERTRPTLAHMLRVNGLVGDSDLHAMYIVGMFSLLLGFWNKLKTQKGRIALGVLGFLLIVNLVGTVDVGGFILFAVAVAAFALMGGKRVRRVAVFCVVSLFACLGCMKILFPNLYYDHMGKTSAVGFRGKMIPVGLEMAKQHPFIGSGPGSFVGEYRRYALRFPSVPKVAAYKSHVTYLTVLVERGLIGLLVFVLIFAFTIKKLVYCVKHEKVNFVAASLIAIIFAYAVFISNSNALYNQHLWIVMGLGSVVGHICVDKKAEA